MSVFSYSLQLALGILLPWSVVRGDLRRLTPEQLRRTWNPATFWCAIVVFGPLCIPVHFVKARAPSWDPPGCCRLGTCCCCSPPQLAAQLLSPRLKPPGIKSRGVVGAGVPGYRGTVRPFDQALVGYRAVADAANKELAGLRMYAHCTIRC